MKLGPGPSTEGLTFNNPWNFSIEIVTTDMVEIFTDNHIKQTVYKSTTQYQQDPALLLMI